MDDNFADTCEAYLDGALSTEAARRFEAELVDPERGQIFGEVLMMRQLLADLPPDAAPADLVARIEADLQAALSGAGGADTAEAARQTSALQSALYGLSWLARGPAMAFSVQPQAASGVQPALDGLANVRYAAGPLLQGKQPPREIAPAKPLWRRALALRQSRALAWTGRRLFSRSKK